MQITPVLLIEWKLWGQLLPNAGVKLAFGAKCSNTQNVCGKIGIRAMVILARWRRTIPIYETLDSYNFYFPHATAAVACLCFRVFRKKPTPLRTYSTRTRMQHLKETRKFSISACLQVASGKQAPTDLTNGFASACVCGPHHGMVTYLVILCILLPLKKICLCVAASVKI